MSALIEWKNQEINRLRRDMERLFGRFWSYLGQDPLPVTLIGLASVDISETKDLVLVRVEIPGLDPDDLEIWVSGDLLTIKGQKRDESSEQRGFYHRVERRFGSFSRSVRLPCKVREEEVKASYNKGVLQIVMPKLMPPKAVKVKVK